MGITFQAAQLTHERFLTIEHSCKIPNIQYYTPEVRGRSVWQMTKNYFAGVFYGQKSLMCQLCSWKRFPHKFTTVSQFFLNYQFGCNMPNFPPKKCNQCNLHFYSEALKVISSLSQFISFCNNVATLSLGPKSLYISVLVSYLYYCNSQHAHLRSK